MRPPRTNTPAAAPMAAPLASVVAFCVISALASSISSRTISCARRLISCRASPNSDVLRSLTRSAPDRLQQAGQQKAGDERAPDEVLRVLLDHLVVHRQGRDRLVERRNAGGGPRTGRGRRGGGRR